jgi:hypothetical protein
MYIASYPEHVVLRIKCDVKSELMKEYERDNFFFFKKKSLFIVSYRIRVLINRWVQIKML